MPVREDANPRWEPLNCDDIKDLKQEVRENGLGSPYFWRNCWKEYIVM